MIQDIEINDEATGQHVVVKTGKKFTKLSVDGRDYFFDRLSGEFTGTGMSFLRGENPTRSRLALALGTICAALVLSGCPKLTGNDKVEDAVNRTNDILLTEPADKCEENPQAQGCGEQRAVEVAVNCFPVTGQPLTAQCNATSAIGNFYNFDWGNGQSSGFARSFSATHLYTTAGTYSVTVRAWEFAEPDINCGTDNAPVTVAP